MIRCIMHVFPLRRVYFCAPFPARACIASRSKREHSSRPAASRCTADRVIWDIIVLFPFGHPLDRAPAVAFPVQPGEDRSSTPWRHGEPIDSPALHASNRRRSSWRRGSAQKSACVGGMHHKRKVRGCHMVLLALLLRSTGSS